MTCSNDNANDNCDGNTIHPLTCAGELWELHAIHPVTCPKTNVFENTGEYAHTRPHNALFFQLTDRVSSPNMNLSKGRFLGGGVPYIYIYATPPKTNRFRKISCLYARVVLDDKADVLKAGLF